MVVGTTRRSGHVRGSPDRAWQRGGGRAVPVGASPRTWSGRRPDGSDAPTPGSTYGPAAGEWDTDRQHAAGGTPALRHRTAQPGGALRRTPPPGGALRHRTALPGGALRHRTALSPGALRRTPYGAPTGYPPGYGFPPQPPYASYWARVGGWLIDWVILAVVINVLNLGFNAARIGRVNFHVTTTVNGTSTIHHYHYSVVGGIVGLVLTLLYGAILCGSARGQTVGMMAVGARAVDGDHGGPIGFGRALWRAFFEYLMFVLCIIPWVLDMLWPAWDSRHQAWHDKVANTIVVKRDARAL